MEREQRRYRKVFVRLWRNQSFRRLNSDAKLISLYLLTGPQTNRVGCYAFSLALAAEDLDLSPTSFAKHFKSACDAFAWEWDPEARVLYIPSWWEWNKPANPNALQGAMGDMAEVPPCALLERVTETLSNRFGEWLGDSARKQEEEQEEEKEQEQEEEQEKDDPALRLQSLWNSLTTPPIPRCRDLTKARRSKIRLRLSEHPLEWWSEAIGRIEASAFCRGENDRGWKASFDWLIQNSDNALKAIEGKYDGRKPVLAGTQKTSGNAAALLAFVERGQAV